MHSAVQEPCERWGRGTREVSGVDLEAPEPAFRGLGGQPKGNHTWTESKGLNTGQSLNHPWEKNSFVPSGEDRGRDPGSVWWWEAISKPAPSLSSCPSQKSAVTDSCSLHSLGDSIPFKQISLKSEKLMAHNFSNLEEIHSCPYFIAWYYWIIKHGYFLKIERVSRALSQTLPDYLSRQRR